MCCIVKYLLEMYYTSKENKEYIIIILFNVIFDHDKGVFTVFSLFSYCSGYIHESFNTNPCPVHIKTFNRFQSVGIVK